MHDLNKLSRHQGTVASQILQPNVKKMSKAVQQMRSSHFTFLVAGPISQMAEYKLVAQESLSRSNPLAYRLLGSYQVNGNPTNKRLILQCLAQEPLRPARSTILVTIFALMFAQSTTR